MAVRGFQPRSMSTKCNKCGVEWNKDKSNKQPKRALCIACYDGELIDRTRAKAKYDREHKVGPNRIELYHNYKVSNRVKFWREINKEIRLCKSRDEIRAFISKQMDRILDDKDLMAYINLTSNAKDLTINSEENKKRKYDNY